MPIVISSVGWAWTGNAKKLTHPIPIQHVTAIKKRNRKDWVNVGLMKCMPNGKAVRYQKITRDPKNVR